MDTSNFSKTIDMKKVSITDEFFSREQELVRREVLPYQWDALNDRVEGAAPSYCMHNFKAAGRLMKKKKKEGSAFIAPKYTFRGFEALPEDPAHPDEDKFYGFVFQDTDFSKWIEAVGYSLIVNPDAELEKVADSAIDIVCEAQLENGYLDTYYIINGMDRSFTNLRDHHELYCLGHLVEGAVSYFKATGKDKLLKAAMRFADYCADYFGPEEEKCKGYPGHEIAEMALVKLYETCGDEKYLKLASFFIDQRGQKPFYFDEEEKKRAELEGTEYRERVIRESGNWFERTPYWYHQAHKPVREQDEAVGHAVRAVYLYSGMADVARLNNDEELFAACKRLWNSIEKDKLFITGGIGATHMGEAFSFPYDLPNDTAYSETCAAIGLVFFARRMLQIEADRKYADVMELALYNTVLAGMALDGKSFFYVNPLEVNPKACDRDERKLHVKPVRQKWFGCACCPPNIARTLSSVSMYAFTESEDTFYTHLYLGSKVEDVFGNLSVCMDADMPWSGNVSVKVRGCGDRKKLAFRIPGWSKNAKVCIKSQGKEYEVDICGETIAVNGREYNSGEWIFADNNSESDLCPKNEMSEADKSELGLCLKNGYLYIDNSWIDAEIIFCFDMKVEILAANNNVRECMGKVAVKRGPVTYCMEEADNGQNLQLLAIDMSKASTKTKDGNKISDLVRVSFDSSLGHRMVVIDVPGKRLANQGADSLYVDALEDEHYEDCTLRFIPYYAWSNRGEGEMSVWVRRF